MKSLKTIQKLSKLGRVLSKIVFIFSVVSFGFALAGMVSVSLGSGYVIKFGKVTLHSLIGDTYGYSLKSIVGALSGTLIVYAGQAVLAKFAEVYFKNELAAGTPFTFAGAKELKRLGILTIVLPTGCAIVASIATGIVAGFLKAEVRSSMEAAYSNAGNITLGLMFLLGALLCRSAAEQTQGLEN